MPGAAQAPGITEAGHVRHGLQHGCTGPRTVIRGQVKGAPRVGVDVACAAVDEQRRRSRQLGFDQLEYAQVMELLGCVDGNLTALLSAHQSIGVPQPLKLFGSELLKKKYLPRCAAGEISAFALTEPEVGSDPARLTTTAELSEDGSYYLMNGTKLWCTNGTLAKMLVVMATHPGSGKISAFVVECEWEGVKVEHRCHFMGLRALANAGPTTRRA